MLVVTTGANESRCLISTSVSIGPRKRGFGDDDLIIVLISSPVTGIHWH